LLQGWPRLRPTELLISAGDEESATAEKLINVESRQIFRVEVGSIEHIELRALYVHLHR
jgi:hypothetical protein